MPFPKKKKRNLSPGMNLGGCLLEYHSGESCVSMRSKTCSARFYFQYLSYYSLNSAYVFFRLRTEESMHSKFTSSFHIYSPNGSEDL